MKRAEKEKQIIPLSEMGPGDFVKVTGKYIPGRGFLAVEIDYEQGEEWVLEGLVQSCQPSQRKICLFEHWWTLPEAVRIKDEAGEAISLDKILPGQLLKLKGRGDSWGNFLIEKVRLKETLEFNVEMIKGTVQLVEAAQQQIRLIGLPVILDENTVILRSQILIQE